MGTIQKYLEQNSDMVQDSGSIINFSLFMVGKSAQRCKPTVMIVSEDKKARKEAYNMIKDSKIMETYPGFELAHIPLTAEYENLRFLAGEGPSSQYLASPSQLPEIFYHADGSLEGCRLYLSQKTNFKQSPRTATAGGVISYQGKRMALTVDHFLERTAIPASRVIASNSEEEDSDGECAITGLSDFDDESEDDFIEITSRGSLTPESVVSDDSNSGDRGSSVFSSGSTINGEEFIAAVQARLGRLGQTQGTIHQAGRSEIPYDLLGKVVQRSSELDYALIDIDPGIYDFADIKNNTIDLDDDSRVEKGPRDAVIRTTTPDGGTVGGMLSGTPSFVRLPHSKTYTEVYIARFSQPLVPGDCGSWVRDAITGNLFGHVFAGSPTSGLTMIIPACNVFENIRCGMKQLYGSGAKCRVVEKDGEDEHGDQERNPEPPKTQAAFPATTWRILPFSPVAPAATRLQSVTPEPSALPDRGTEIQREIALTFRCSYQAIRDKVISESSPCFESIELAALKPIMDIDQQECIGTRQLELDSVQQQLQRSYVDIIDLLFKCLAQSRPPRISTSILLSAIGRLDEYSEFDSRMQGLGSDSLDTKWHRWESNCSLGALEQTARPGLQDYSLEPLLVKALGWHLLDSQSSFCTTSALWRAINLQGQKSAHINSRDEKGESSWGLPAHGKRYGRLAIWLLEPVTNLYVSRQRDVTRPTSAAEHGSLIRQTRQIRDGTDAVSGDQKGWVSIGTYHMGGREITRSPVDPETRVIRRLFGNSTILNVIGRDCRASLLIATEAGNVIVLDWHVETAGLDHIIGELCMALG